MFYSLRNIFPTFKLLCEENIQVWFIAQFYVSFVELWFLWNWCCGKVWGRDLLGLTSPLPRSCQIYFSFSSSHGFTSQLFLCYPSPPLPFPPLLFYTTFFFFPFSDRVCSSARAGLEIPRTVGTAGCTPHRARHALLIVIVIVLRGGILRGGLARRTLPSWMDYCNSVSE